MRGLKYLASLLLHRTIKVALLVSAWIEIIVLSLFSLGLAVALLVSAWIEIATS